MSSGRSAPSGSVATDRFAAFGGTAVIAATDPDMLPAVREAAERTAAAFDRACSRFRDDSELMALNATPGVDVPVSPLLLDAVQAALRAARLTDGDVDPTIGAALVALGYDRDFASVGAATAATSQPARVAFSRIPGWRTVVVDPAAGTIRLGRGVSLDLGATAKALAADRAAAAAQAAAGCGVLISFSGDIALAGAPPGEGWSVRVTDDHRASVDAPGQWITLQSGGLASSSTTVRRWQTAERDHAHHVLDPATGLPAAVVWRTVSVTAGSCLDANIASTAAIVRGEAAPAWLSSLGLPSRLVALDGSVRHIAGWPPAGDDLL